MKFHKTEFIITRRVSAAYELKFYCFTCMENSFLMTIYIERPYNNLESAKLKKLIAALFDQHNFGSYPILNVF